MGWVEAFRRAWGWALRWPEDADHVAEAGRQRRLAELESAVVGPTEEWTVPSTRMRTILAPTDLSELSTPAVAYAAGLAALLQTGLVVLHVADENEAYEALRDHGMYLDQFLKWRKGEVEAALLAAIPHPTLGAVPTDVRIVFGRNAAVEIVRSAREVPADLIVMATHGRTGLSRLMLGSVAEQVVRDAPCPVVLFRPRLVPAAIER